MDLMMMFEKINIKDIFKSHCKLLSKSDLFLFFGGPCLISYLFVYFGIYLSVNSCSTLLAILAITIPLLLNLLILLYNMIQNVYNDTGFDDEDKKLKLEGIKETSFNISFAISMSFITLVIIGFLWFITNNYLPVGTSTEFAVGMLTFNMNLFLKIFSFTVFWLLGCILLTILMILKRIYYLIYSEFEM